MFIVYPVVFGILAGYLTGGRLKWLVRKTFKWKWLVALALLVQVLIFSDIPFTGNLPSQAIVSLHIVSYICLLLFAFLNIHIKGMLSVGAGIFCNALVIFANGGYMPTISDNLRKTSFEKSADAISQGNAVHNSIQMTRSTLFPWLGDIFTLPSQLPLSNVFSIGDILIGTGIFIYLLVNMKHTASDVQTAGTSNR